MLLPEVRHTREIRNFLQDSYFLKKIWIFSWKMISSKRELFGLIANIFLFISSRIWSRFSPPPKILFSKKCFMDKKQTKSTLPWLRVQTGGNFRTARPGLRKALASWQSLFSKVARSTHVCPRHTSNDFTGEANPVQIISNIDLLRPSFPVNINFLLAATIRETYFQG